MQTGSDRRTSKENGKPRPSGLYSRNTTSKVWNPMNSQFQRQMKKCSNDSRLRPSSTRHIRERRPTIKSQRNRKLWQGSCLFPEPTPSLPRGGNSPQFCVAKHLLRFKSKRALCWAQLLIQGLTPSHSAEWPTSFGYPRGRADRGCRQASSAVLTPKMIGGFTWSGENTAIASTPCIALNFPA